ncbi:MULTISPECIES: metal ABC transporter solute-binding protein, Zn/Mn family [Bacillaceae]|uniref:metal ABC transporter solute-binding protein, Zn/Mn family n=1 Tax=Bacillaceae TaxID=186817 RepID=UPI0014567BF2|nr:MULTISPECIES: zinc ABC transporter substrate-binding protein [Bacillaceae]NLP52110.1 zinc ABC transporter solute-binding protein [Bacillus sp. RO1]UAL46459.1 zinc ABC transporter substrate-binding protein [Sutcliffiella horikoshii]
MYKRIKFLMISFIIISLISGCIADQSINEDKEYKQLTIFTTIYPLEYFTKRIGGSLVSIENIVPPGSDAHSIDLSPSEMVKVAKGDAFIYSGTGLEGFAMSIIESLEDEQVMIVNATENITLLKSSAKDQHSDDEKKHENEKSEVDPHFWLDPIRSIEVADNIKKSLVELYPEEKEIFEANFISLKRDLEKLDAEFNEMIKSAEKKKFIVSHSAYGYWEERYGLEQIGISGISPSDEPSQQQLIEIINLMGEEGLTHLFFEENLNNKVAKTVQNETGTSPLFLHNLESLSEDRREAKEDYLSIMKNNIKVLGEGLD